MNSVANKRKIVMRKLPPGLTAETLFGLTDTAGFKLPEVVSSRYFVCGGKSSSGFKVRYYSRAYFCFNSPKSAIDFYSKFNGYTFIDPHGLEMKATVEFAPNQKQIPSNTTKQDKRQGTIEEDSHFKAFLEELNKPKPIPVATTIGTSSNHETNSVQQHKRTPLIESIIAERERAKEQASNAFKLSILQKQKEKETKEKEDRKRNKSERKRGKRAGKSTRMKKLLIQRRKDKDKEDGTYARAKIRNKQEKIIDSEGFVRTNSSQATNQTHQTQQQQQQQQQQKKMKKAVEMAVEVNAALNEPLTVPVVSIAKRPLIVRRQQNQQTNQSQTANPNQQSTPSPIIQTSSPTNPSPTPTERTKLKVVRRQK